MEAILTSHIRTRVCKKCGEEKSFPDAFAGGKGFRCKKCVSRLEQERMRPLLLSIREKRNQSVVELKEGLSAGCPRCGITRLLSAFRTGPTEPCNVCESQHLRLRRRLERRVCNEPIVEVIRGSDDYLYKAYLSDLYKAARQRARQFNVPFTITPQILVEKLRRGYCERSGIPFQLDKDGVQLRHKHNLTPSVDRREPNKGYTPENTELVVWAFNRMKSDLSYSFLAEMVCVALIKEGTIQLSGISSEFRSRIKPYLYNLGLLPPELVHPIRSSRITRRQRDKPSPQSHL